MAKISEAEPTSQLRRIPIAENGEPLVDFLSVCPRLVLDHPQFTYRRETLLRVTVVEMLCKANQLLPTGYQIAILEGWRAPLIQERMYRTMWKKFSEMHPDWSELALKRKVNQFVAPNDIKSPAPHTTGGALDVALWDEDGIPLDMISPYVPNDAKGFPMKAPGLSDRAKANRALLADTLARVGLTNYPSEYWHFSYGDQGWAYRGSHSCAVFGAITPEAWSPDPADVSDMPLAVVSSTQSRAGSGTH